MQGAIHQLRLISPILEAFGPQVFGQGLLEQGRRGVTAGVRTQLIQRAVINLEKTEMMAIDSNSI